MIEIDLENDGLLTARVKDIAAVLVYKDNNGKERFEANVLGEWFCVTEESYDKILEILNAN